MFNVKKVNFKKICITVLSLSMIFAMLTPNFASADDDIAPGKILFVVNSRELVSTAGACYENEFIRQFDQRSLKVKINDINFEGIRLPQDSFRVEGLQEIRVGDSLCEWLNENAGMLLDSMRVDMIVLDIWGEIGIIKSDRTPFLGEILLCKVIIKHESDRSIAEEIVPYEERIRSTFGEEEIQVENQDAEHIIERELRGG